MPLTFYPHIDEAFGRGTLQERMDALLDAAQRYKAIILDDKQSKTNNIEGKLTVPKDLVAAYNWEEIAHVLREIRELPESNKTDKLKKSELLTRLAEIYEVLRAAKLSKLEAVRLALMSEASQLRGGSQVA